MRRLLLAAVLLLACKGEVKPAPQLVMPEWQDGEVSTYSIVRRDSVLFRRTISLAFDEESEVPLAVLTSVITPESARVFFTDSTVAALRRFSLKPAWSYRVVATDVSGSEVVARYDDDGLATVRKETVEGAEERELRVPADCYGAEMVALAFRGLPLDPGVTYGAHVLIPLEFRVEPVTVKVLGTRRVATPLGDIICREVELVEARRRVRMAYEIAQPHRLVLIGDADNETETVLVGYVPAGVDTVIPEELPLPD